MNHWDHNIAPCGDATEVDACPRQSKLSTQMSRFVQKYTAVDKQTSSAQSVELRQMALV